QDGIDVTVLTPGPSIQSAAEREQDRKWGHTEDGGQIQRERRVDERDHGRTVKRLEIELRLANRRTAGQRHRVQVEMSGAIQRGDEIGTRRVATQRAAKLGV